jgi:uncharacterized protein YbjT (DUF2867 family)
MKNILITGATGNIGMEVIKYLFKCNTTNRIVAGVRNIEKAKLSLKNFPSLDYTVFDFEDPSTFDKSLHDIDIIFILRPPHIADINLYFKPLILKIKEHGINKVVFLSVLGAEKSKIIPHNKIEKFIVDNQLDYVFLRPSYFMQNLTTTLWSELHNQRMITLPAGNAKFNWVDIENIAEIAAMVLAKFDQYKDTCIEITGTENENFENVVATINQQIQNKIKYRVVSPFLFYKLKKKEGMETGMIVVMIMLHILPRFQKEPYISDNYEKITGNKPTTLSQFVAREVEKFK